MLFEFAGFVLDESAFELRRDGEAVKIDPKAFGMLRYLLRHPGLLITRDELVRHVWDGRAQSDTVLTGTVSRLRAALGSCARDQFIVSVYGQGYRFAGNVRQQPSVSSKPSNGTPFVGRAAVLERVQVCLEQARTGRGRIIAIVGEPGIGKTHLAEMCAEKAAEVGVPSAWGLCRELETAPPFWPFVQLLRGALRTSSSSTLARSAVVASLSALRPERDPAAGWSAGASNYRMFDGISRALHKLTDDGPLFLVVDDVQWADAASLKLFAYLAPEVSRMRLLILATARNTGPTPGGHPLAPILGHRNCEYIELERLTEPDVAEYTALSFGGAASEVSRAVFDRSEGNPFFMVELLRPFWRAAAPSVDELALTGPALDIVRERLRTLSPKAISLLSAAAIVGREFDLGLLGHVAELDPPTILDLLDDARETGTVRPTGDAGHFVFGHDLIRSVLLANLSTSQSARLHLRAADALEGRFPVGRGVPRPEIVHHLLTALPLGDSEKAVDYATRSALAAAHVCAHADAAKLLRRALSALELVREVHPRSRCDLLLRLSFCERALADEHFSEHMSQAVALGREHGFGEILAEAGRHMSLAPGFLAVKGARDVLEAADRALPADSHLLRSDVLAHLAWTAPYCFDSELVASLVARAEALARESKDPAALAIALSAKMYFVKGPDSQELAEAIAQQIDLLYAAQPPLIRVHWRAQREFSRIVVSLQRGDAAAVERAMAAFGAAARELKHPELEWHHRRAGVVDRMNRGPWFGLKDALQDLEDRAEALHLFSFRGVGAVDWIVLVRETQPREALLPLESTLVLQEADCPYRRARKIRSLAELGAIEKARTALNDLRPERLERLPHDRDFLATLVHLAVASIATRSQEHAQVLYALLSPYPHLYAADLSLHCDGSVSHVLGELARSFGRMDKSVEHLEVALDQNERAGLGPRVAHSAYALASVLSQSANRQTARRARALYARALALSLELGMEPLRHQVEPHLCTT